MSLCVVKRHKVLTQESIFYSTCDIKTYLNLSKTNINLEFDDIFLKMSSNYQGPC